MESPAVPISIPGLLAIMISFACIAHLHVVTGELAPNALANDRPAEMASVRNRGGPVLGLGALEDGLEEIVGKDENDVPTSAGIE